MNTRGNTDAERLRALIDQTGLHRRDVARLLGYSSDNSIRQCESGKAKLPADQFAWLKRYAAMRSKLAETEAGWLQQNPPPVKPPVDLGVDGALRRAERMEDAGDLGNASRLRDMAQMRRAGATLGAIGRHFGMSRQRVHRILQGA